MGKTKHPDEVKPKQFSDSLELFDSLFREELQSGTKTTAPPTRPGARRPTASKKVPDEKIEKTPNAGPKRQAGGQMKRPQAKPPTAPRGTSPPRAKPPVTSPGKPPKPQSPANSDTLEIRRNSAQPISKPEQSNQRPLLERKIVPQGVIVKGIDQIEEPYPNTVKPVGKLYTPKESKSIIPSVSIKESNLYKVVLSGFALAIIVMVVINFFGIMGSDKSRDASPIKKEAVQKAPAKERPPRVAKKPKNAKAVKAPKKTAKKRTSGRTPPTTPSKPLVKKAKNPQINQKSVKKLPVVPVSTPSSVATQPNVAKEVPKVREETDASESFQKHLAEIIKQQKTTSPESPPDADATIVETAKKEPDVTKRPEPMVMKQQETTSPFTSLPSSSRPQKTEEKPVTVPKLKAYPYSVYLGAYKTLERAKVAVSQYKEKGFSSHWVKVDLGRKGIWYRLFTGHFSDEESAQDFIDLWDLQEAHVKLTRYSTLVGVYPSKDAIESKSEALLKLGYSTYVVDGFNGTSQLYSGAFVTKAGAEKQYEDLVAKGIRTQVVER